MEAQHTCLALFLQQNKSEYIFTDVIKYQTGKQVSSGSGDMHSKAN